MRSLRPEHLLGFVVATFFLLALFFTYPIPSIPSIYGYTLEYFGGYNSYLIYVQVRSLIHIITLAGGLLLTVAFIKNSADPRWTGKLVAVNYSLLNLVIQSSLGLGFQWVSNVYARAHSFAWIFLDLLPFLFFIFTLFCIIVAWGMWSNRVWAYRIGKPTIALILVVEIFVILLTFASRTLLFEPFQATYIILSATTFASLYHLGKYTFLARLRKFSIFREQLHLISLRSLLTLFQIAIILVSIVEYANFSVFSEQYKLWNPVNQDLEECYIGVTFSSETSDEAKKLIDKVKNISNLLVINSGPVSKNEVVLDEICDYAVDSGLYILVYFGVFDRSWHEAWLDKAQERWGERILGIYYYDEPGGIQLDVGGTFWYVSENPPEDYDEAAQLFIQAFQYWPGGVQQLKLRNIPVFTSDYALYWFDYLAGYDILLAQLGWNHSRAQDIALVRGAANVQNKKWGSIITWTYDKRPYLGNGDELYEDMKISYEAGAQYIVVFNYPKTNEYGILEGQHFEALEKFWNDTIKTGKIQHAIKNSEAALILPDNYGWGMRYSSDTIWGLWGPDEKTPQIWNITRILLKSYDFQLDIIYEDPKFIFKDKYITIYSWNQTLTSRDFPITPSDS